MGAPHVMSKRSIIGLVAALVLVIAAPLAKDAIGGDFDRGSSPTAPVRMPAPSTAAPILLR